MSIIKLLPGQRIALTVTATEDVKGTYGPQIKFSGRTPDDPDAILFLNVEPAQRQLERIGLNVQSVVGQTIDVEKVDKNGTKYTNIYRANGTTPAQTKAAATSAKQPFSSGGPLPWEGEETGAPPAEAQGVDFGAINRLTKQFNLYDACLDHALAAAKQRFGNDVTDTAVAAMCATLYIQANQKGLGV